MRKFLLALSALAFASCIYQTVKTQSIFLDHRDFDEVWTASIRAVNDIGFTIDGLDKDAGFIGAESGRHVGQDAPPRLSILIREARGRIYVDCKVLQKEQHIDVFGHGKRTIQRFMTALNMNLDY